MKYETKNRKARTDNRVDGSAPKERSAPLKPPYVRVSYTAVRTVMG